MQCRLIFLQNEAIYIEYKHVNDNENSLHVDVLH